MTLFVHTWRFLQVNLYNKSLTADLIRRDFKIKYIGSLLGRYWSFLHPLAMIAIYSIVFVKVLQLKMGKEAFSHPWAFTLYLCAGMLPWSVFSEMLSRGVGIFHEHANLVKKVSFPKEILLTIAVGSSSITLFVSLVLYLALLLASNFGISLWAVLLVIIVPLQLLFTYGLSLFLSVCNVFFRDIQQIIPIVVQIWFWLTPIVYTAAKVPSDYRWILYCNPFYYFISLYQDVLFYQQQPQLAHATGAFIWAVLSFWLGSLMYHRFHRTIADEL